MEIVVTAHQLSAFGGSESYAVTVADHLQRLGHEIWLTAPVLGDAAAAARELGLRVVLPDDLPHAPDAILSQDAAIAYELAASHPEVPQVYVAHSDTFDLQLPPAVEGVVATVVTLYDRVDRRVRALAAGHRVVRLTQPVDVERFKPGRPLPDRPRVALTLGNYVHGPRAELLREACELAGIELRHVGSYGDDGQTGHPAAALDAADIVFGKARVVLEAMACGRAAYVYDHNGGEGWVTDESRAALAADNFGGQSAPRELDARRLADDLRAYDPATGLTNRDYVVAHHAASKHAAALVELLRDAGIAPRRRPDAVLREMARLVRLYHRADAIAFAQRADLAAVAARAEALDRAVAEQQGRAERAEARAGELDALLAAERERADAATLDGERAWREAAAHAEAAEQARAAFHAVADTRRWRALNRLLRPLDRRRGQRR